MMKATSALPFVFLLLAACSSFVLGEDNIKCPGDTEQNIIYYNVVNTTQDSQFEKNLATVYDILLQQAPIDSSAQVKIGETDEDRVYGFAGCFQGDCEKCLKTSIGYFQSIAPLAIGARLCLNTGSEACYLRYENYSY